MPLLLQAIATAAADDYDDAAHVHAPYATDEDKTLITATRGEERAREREREADIACRSESETAGRGRGRRDYSAARSHTTCVYGK